MMRWLTTAFWIAFGIVLALVVIPNITWSKVV